MIKTIAILLVMLVVNLLMILSVSRAARRVDYSLRRYFVQKLGQDDLGISLPESIPCGSEEAEAESAGSRIKPPVRAGQGAVLFAADEQRGRAGYKNDSLKEDYKAIKRISEFTPESALRRAKERVKNAAGAEVFKDYKGMFDMLDYDTVYAMNSLDPEKQEELLRSTLKEEHAEILDDFLEENSGRFDCIEFYGYLDQMAALYNSEFSILTGSAEDDGRELEDGTTLTYDSKICEGSQVIYRNRMYDFSI